MTSETIDKTESDYFTMLDIVRPQAVFLKSGKHENMCNYKTLLQDVTRKPNYFQKLMSSIFRGLNWKLSLIYMDTIIIGSNTFKEHIDHIQQVFETLRKAKLRLKLSKCIFASSYVKYNGHVVDKRGVRPDPDNINVISEYPTPKNTKQLRTFLSLAAYYKKFVRNFSELAYPLYKLTSKNVKFKWNLTTQVEFYILKDAIKRIPILLHPDFDKSFKIYTDINDYQFGMIITQKRKLIIFFSRKLNLLQQNYTMIEKIKNNKNIEKVLKYIIRSMYNNLY